MGEIWVEARVRYRKFDQTYVDYVYPDGLEIELPITDLGVGRYPASELDDRKSVATWTRWNDFGIGNLRKPRVKNAEYQLLAAREAFHEVVRQGSRQDGLMLQGPISRIVVSIRRRKRSRKRVRTARSLRTGPSTGSLERLTSRMVTWMRLSIISNPR